MNLIDTNTVVFAKKYVCPFCNFKTHKKYNLDMHKINRHSADSSCSGKISRGGNIFDAQAQAKLETSQTGSGTILEEQSTPQNVQQDSLHQQNVHLPIEDYNYAARQWRVFASSFKNIEVRNKQLEAENRQLNAWIDEAAESLEQKDNEITNLQAHLQNCINANNQLSKAYSHPSSENYMKYM